MKEIIQTAELRTITPELGLFTITGQFEEVQDQQKLFERMNHVKCVTPSKFDRAMMGKRMRRLQLF